MGKSSGTQTTSTVQKADPWSGIQPALTELYNSALQNFYGPGPQYYPGSTVAPLSIPTQLSQDLWMQRALEGSPLTSQAQQEAYSTLGGDYFYNPANLGLLGLGSTNFAATSPALQSLYGLAGRDFLSSNIGTQGLQQMAGQDFSATNPAMQSLYALGGRDFSSSLPGMSALQGLAGSDYLSQSDAARRLQEMSGFDFFGQTPGMGTLQQIAGGSMLNANPYIDQMFQQASGRVGEQFSKSVQPGIASMFAGAGRFGSGQMAAGLEQSQQQFGDTLNRLATDIYGQNYAQERGMQQQALGMLGQFGMGAQGLRQSALENLISSGLASRGLQTQAAGQLGQLGLSGAGLNQQILGQLAQYGLMGRDQQQQALQTLTQAGLAGQGMQQQAYSQLGQMGLQSQQLQQQAYSDLAQQFARERAMQLSTLGMVPQLAGMDYFDIGQLGQLGQQQDAYSQALLSGDINRYNYYQNLPTQELQMLNSLLQGGLTLSGQTGTSTSPYTSSPLMGALGGGMMGSQIGGALSPFFGGAALGPWGMGIGALLGLFSE